MPEKIFKMSVLHREFASNTGKNLKIFHVQLFKMYSNTDPAFDAWPDASPSCEVCGGKNGKSTVNFTNDSDVDDPMDVDILSEMIDQTIIEAANEDQNKENNTPTIKGVKRKRQKKIKFSHKKRYTRPPATCKSF